MSKNKELERLQSRVAELEAAQTDSESTGVTRREVAKGWIAPVVLSAVVPGKVFAQVSPTPTPTPIAAPPTPQPPVPIVPPTPAP
ncbi:hypothetical protein [Candidatus Marimicrobium litorale]|uniref:hypothetical protein n=1 Tax=Candidatus Marimicrobium litorale TaxID=2518991 RepID=UPI002431F7B0|nr:hypothetical protein [Candidatus Marimicrobium litorale]